MSSGPELAIALKLRLPHSDNIAFDQIADGARKYRGFELGDQEKGFLVISHQDYELYIYTMEGFDQGDVDKEHSIILLEADMDDVLDEDDTPDFWKAYQNVIAMVVAQTNPLFGITSDSETIIEMIKEGLHKYLSLGVYFSFDFIKATIPKCEDTIKKNASRELQYGYLVPGMMMSESKAKRYIRDMKRNLGEEQ